MFLQHFLHQTHSQSLPTVKHRFLECCIRSLFKYNLEISLRAAQPFGKRGTSPGPGLFAGAYYDVLRERGHYNKVYKKVLPQSGPS